MLILSYFINIIYNICIYILSIKYNNATQNNRTARAIGKLVCSTPFEIPIENVLSQRKLRVGLTVYNDIFTSFCLIENCISVYIFTTFNAEYSYIYHTRDIIS